MKIYYYKMTDSVNEFHIGKYFYFDVIIMTKNGYINATKLCKDNGRRFDNWSSTIFSSQLINKISIDENIPIGNVTILNMKGLNDYRGTYVNRKLVPSIISWISAEHAIRMNTILDIVLKAKPEQPEILELTNFLQKVKIKSKKYCKIKRDNNIHIPKNYPKEYIVNIVKPFEIIDDLSGNLDDIKKKLKEIIPKKYGVYMLYNNETNEYYIGSSKSLISRVSVYLTDIYVSRESKYKDLMKKAMIKYTKSAFSLLILELVDDHSELLEREMYYIELLEPSYNTDLYKLL
jgi:KilA-N domain/GIY-YIG catalytic domain